MKPSHEFRRHTFAARLDWRTDCSRLGIKTQEQQVKIQLRDVLAYAFEARLTHAYLPIFTSLERIETLLKSLKYVIVLALLLSGSQAEARYRHVHHHSSVDRTVRVYDPPRVEARDTAEQVASVFDTGYYELRYPGFDISYNLYVTPPHAIDTTPPPIVESSPIPDYVPVYAKMLIALGMLVLLTPLAYRVTGRCDDPTVRYWRKSSPAEIVTLVETRWWLPISVSAAYCHAKHYVRLR